MRGLLLLVVATIVLLAPSPTVGAPAPFSAVTIETKPHWPLPISPTTEVWGVMRIEGEMPDRICMGYEMVAVGNGIPYMRRPYAPMAVLSCRKPEWNVERFKWNTVWDGVYKVFGWSERNGKIESRPFDIEMVVQ
jgi:hypothetical protein